jgi:TolA-binding protein
MKKMMRLQAISGAICLSMLCLSADSSPKPIHRSQSDRLESLERQNLELKKQVVELNQKLDILTRRVNECAGGGGASNSFTEENISRGPSPQVPGGMETVRIKPESSGSATVSGPAATATGRPKGHLIITSNDDDLASIVPHDGPLPGTSYVPPPDPAGGSGPPPVLSYAPSASSAPASAPAGNSAALAAGEAAAYKQLKDMWSSDRTDLAVPLMEEYLKKHPKGAHEDEVAYHLGDYYFSQGEFAKAAEAFRRLRETHYTSNLAPDAIYKLGLCYEKLGMAKEAQEALEEVVSIYPFSDAAPKATRELQSIR